MFLRVDAEPLQAGLLVEPTGAHQLLQLDAELAPAEREFERGVMGQQDAGMLMQPHQHLARGHVPDVDHDRGPATHRHGDHHRSRALLGIQPVGLEVDPDRLAAASCQRQHAVQPAELARPLHQPAGPTDAHRGLGCAQRALHRSDARAGL
nr:hypothetical protein [Conexibacter sp. W3-3-2]